MKPIITLVGIWILLIGLLGYDFSKLDNATSQAESATWLAIATLGFCLGVAPAIHERLKKRKLAK